MSNLNKPYKMSQRRALAGAIGWLDEMLLVEDVAEWRSKFARDISTDLAAYRAARGPKS